MESKMIIEKLLTLLEAHYNDGIYREIDLGFEIKNAEDLNVYKLTLKGERDKGTPLYSGSLTTMIVKESYCNNIMVYAEVLYSTAMED